jgi:hypothetical protein
VARRPSNPIRGRVTDRPDTLRRVLATLRRFGLLVPLLAGALLLVFAEFSTLYEIHVITAVPEGGTYSGGPHHGYALLVVAIALVPMSIGAVVGGSRPAALACLVLSLLAVVVVLAVDLPDLNETGLIGRTYEAAEARPGRGFYFESLGAVLGLIGAVGTLLLRGQSSVGTAGPRPSSSSSRSVEGSSSASA